MSCGDFRKEWEPGASDAHAAACGACGQWLAAQRDLLSALSRLAAQLEAAEPSSREAELRRAFRGVQVSASRRPHLGRFVGWAAAAGFVGFVGLVTLVVRGHHPSALGKRAPATAMLPAPAVVSPLAKARPSGVPQQLARRAAPRTAPRVPSGAAPVPLGGPPSVSPSPPSLSDGAIDDAFEVAAAEAAASEADAAGARSQRAAGEQGFYPLLPDWEPSAIDSGQIVRVQLRPDVLSAAGLRSRTPDPGPVEAEVLMGPDGVALGIRLAKSKR